MTFDLLENVKQKIPQNYIICFCTGIVVGVITHFYMLTNKFPNWDDVNCINATGSDDFLGRWFLKVVHPIGGSASMPAVHGFLAIVFLSLAVCLIVGIMKLKSTTAMVLTAALFLTFPSVACTMTFMFMSHTSAIAICMVCLGIYLLREYRFGWIGTCVLLICSMGIYQSYMSFAIALMLMGMIMDGFRGKETDKIIKHGILCVIVLIVSVLIYMQLCHYFYPAMSKTEYGGFNEMGQIVISEIPIMVARCYKRFLEYFIWKPFAFVTPIMQRMNIAACVLAVVFFSYLVYVKKLYKEWLRCGLVVVLCFFLPLATAFVYFMAPKAPFSMLMLYAYVLIFVMVVGLLELCFEHWESSGMIEQWKRWAVSGVTIVTTATILLSCYGSYLVTNKAYFRMNLSYERVTSYFNRMITRVEEQEGFQNGDRVAIMGEFYYTVRPSSVEIPVIDSEDLREMSGVALENGLITSGVRDNFIEYYVGFDTGDVEWSIQKEIAETKEFQEMGVYPSKSSIAKINGVWVVKVCEGNAQLGRIE